MRLKLLPHVWQLAWKPRFVILINNDYLLLEDCTSRHAPAIQPNDLFSNVRIAYFIFNQQESPLSWPTSDTACLHVAVTFVTNAKLDDAKSCTLPLHTKCQQVA